MGVPSVSGVRLALGATRLRFPLEAMKRRRRDTDVSGLRPPRIGAPRVSDELELKPIRDIALREIISHADSGTARVYLPLVGTKIRKGLFSIEIPDGAQAVIDVVVQNGRILRDREHTKGDIVPDISLPLGLKFRGVFLDDDGSLIADIARFPNINLSWLNVAKLRVPETLDGLLDILFRDRETEADDDLSSSDPGDDGDDNSGASVPVQLRHLRVEARDVEPRERPLALGEAGEISLGAETRLDIDVSEDALEIGGHVDIPNAELSGAGFSVRGLTASGEGSAALQRGDDRELVLEFRCREASVVGATVELLDGSHLEFGDSVAEDVDIAITRAGGEVHFHVATKAFKGKLTGGVLMTWIGRKVHPLQLSEMEIEGAVAVSDKHFDVDVEVRGARIEAHGVSMPLGLAYLDIGALDASGSGRLRAGTEYGYAFSGSLAVNAVLSGGKFYAGPASARFVEGTRIALQLTRAGGRERLHEIEASGTIEAALASGSIPITARSRLKFSRGATGTVALHSIKLDPGDTWPRIEAGAQLTAAADAFALEDWMEFPAGVVSVEIPSIVLEEDGDLVLEEVSVELSTE